MSAPFVLRGEVDLATAPGVAEQLRRHIASTTDDVLVDCRALEFIDSTGIGVLVDARRQLQADGRALQIVHLDDPGRRAVEILGLTEFLGVTELTSAAGASAS
jgi:anti-sigma B factor antagonist